jgi:hypothetical protein
MGEFKNSGLSKADLARRLGKGADRVSKMLGGPGNWTIATVSDLLFAIKGGVPKYAVDYPLDRPSRNYTSREKFFSSISSTSTDAEIKQRPDQTYQTTTRVAA